MQPPQPPITCFGILGAGTLGWRIGLQAALSGYTTLLYDVSAPQLERAQRLQANMLGRLVHKGHYPEAFAKTAHDRITVTTDAAEFAERVDFVSESVTEQLELKRDVWSGFAERWTPGTRLTTNTSYLLPSQLADVVGDAANFCAFHFHDVFDARVVDVMPHADTDAALVSWLMRLGRTLRQVPVHVSRETSGYLFNHMLMAYLGAAGHLLASDTASAQDIDRSWMGNLGTRIGPFGMMDQVGLDTVLHILSARTDRRSVAFRELIAPMVAAGRLGRKSGEGFYAYPDPAFARAEFLQ